MFNMPCISAVLIGAMVAYCTPISPIYWTKTGGKTFSYVDGKKTGQFGDTASLQERIHTAEHMPGIEIVD